MPENQLPENPILNRFFLSPQEKLEKENGKAILKAFYTQQTTGGNLNYFQKRNARWINLLLWSKGSQSMQEFLDYMSVSDANKSYVKIDMEQQRVAAQFVGTLVESMAKNKTYPCVNAIDDGSLEEKEQRKLDALFRMHEVETLQAVQEEAGMEIEPPNAYVPDDELSATVYFELEDRLPKEIRFEKMLDRVHNDIKYDRVLNRKGLYDLVVLNFEATKIEKLAPKQYTVRKCVPANMVYNFFMSDTGECEVTMVGEFYSLKVKDFRSRYGKSAQNPQGLDEKQIFELAKLSSNQNIGTFNLMWNDTWALTSFNQNRPYDDNSILVLDAEVNCGEDVYYVSKLDAFGRPDIQEKKSIPYIQQKADGTLIEQPKPEGTEIIKKNRQSWMRGVYAPYGDVMLYWGKPDIIINEYTDTYKALSSYTINIPNNDGEYVPSLFERILEPLKEYTLTKLKRKQLIAKLKPSGIRIDVESARNIDLGNGDSIGWEEIVRIYDQTGNELWSSKGINPLEKEAPALSPSLKNNDISEIIGLTQILQGIIMEIRQLIGVPQYRDGSDVGDRTSGVLQEQQNISSYNVTDFILNAHNQLWEETDYKLCLLHWNDIVKTEPESRNDLLNARFEVNVKMKSSDYQKQLIENDIKLYSQVVDKEGNPLLSPKDAMMIREVSNFKLAMWYLTATFEKRKKESEERSARLQEQNGRLQQESLVEKGKQDAQLQKDKFDADKEMLEFENTKAKELALLNGVLTIASKGIPMPSELSQLIQLLVPNIAIPLARENQQMQENIVAEEQQKAIAQEQQAMAEQQQGQPQEQMQPQQMQ
jgi:hypothetical protein